MTENATVNEGNGSVPAWTTEGFVKTILHLLKKEDSEILFSGSDPLIHILTVIAAVICVINVTGNVLVIVSVLRFSTMRRWTNHLFLCLSLADLLQAVFCIPATMNELQAKLHNSGQQTSLISNKVTCIASTYFRQTSIIASLGFLLFIAMERWLVIGRETLAPTPNQQRRFIKTGVASVWMSALLFSLPVCWQLDMVGFIGTKTEERIYKDVAMFTAQICTLPCNTSITESVINKDIESKMKYYCVSPNNRVTLSQYYIIINAIVLVATGVAITFIYVKITNKLKSSVKQLKSCAEANEDRKASVITNVAPEDIQLIHNNRETTAELEQCESSQSLLAKCYVPDSPTESTVRQEARLSLAVTISRRESYRNTAQFEGLIRSRQRLMNIIIMMLAVFFICTVPYLGMTLYVGLFGDENGHSINIYAISFTLLVVQGAVNPVLLFTASQKFQNSLRSFRASFVKAKKAVQSNLTTEGFTYH